MLAKHSRDEAGQFNPVEFMDFLCKPFSVQMQRCNAKVIQRKVARLNHKGRRLVNYSTQYFSH